MKWLLLFSSILLGAISQVFFKRGVSGNSLEGIAFYLSLLRSFNIWAGVAGYALSFAIWLVSLKYFDVSIARSYTSLGYLITYVLAIFLLNEAFTVRRVAAVVIITVGVLLLK